MDKKYEQKDSAEIAEKNHDVSGYQSSNQAEKGMAITHEQATDTLTEGTIDAKIDQVDEQGNLQSHDGEDIEK